MRAMKHTVGILGGGQLARMLAEAAHRLGISVTVFTARADDPAAQVTTRHILGSMSDRQALQQFLASVDVVVFESEFFDTALLADAAHDRNVRFAPSLDAIRQLQDKLTQKELLDRLGIATATHLIPRKDESIDDFVSRALDALGGAAVLKWARLGYDGKGVLIVDGSDASRMEARAFASAANEKNVPLFAERRIDFVRELAVVATRSTRGEFIAYPLVISEQQRSICKLVTGPATALGVSAELEHQAHDAARALAGALDYTGTFAIEFFETREGALLVNEIAPRVHNSGHYTQDACATSQFENHWRAVLGMPLGNVQPRHGFAMLNLLGPEGIERANDDVQPPFPSKRGHVHWYGKSRIVPWRKLGHVNGCTDAVSQLDGLVAELREIERAWSDRVRGERE
jgi:5-(carboxyamino)imidazole ribonucleotide synthase